VKEFLIKSSFTRAIAAAFFSSPRWLTFFGIYSHNDSLKMNAAQMRPAIWSCGYKFHSNLYNSMKISMRPANL
jgi:hypothetical protein